MSRVVAISVAAVTLCVFTGSAVAANFAPVVVTSVVSEEVLVGEVVAFSSEGTVDPDAGPATITYLWDFDDGAISTLPSPTHVFADARAYSVTLTADDGEDTSVASVTVYVLAAPGPAPSSSGPLALETGGQVLWVVNPDSSSVSVVDVSSSASPVKDAEIPTERYPRTVALRPSFDEALIVCQGDNSLTVISTATREATRSVPVGHAPYGIALAATGEIVVTNQGDDTVDIFTPDLSERSTIIVSDGPRAIAITGDGTKAFVTHFISRGAAGQISVIDIAQRSLVRTVPLVENRGPDTPSSGRGVPNLLSAATIDPSGSTLWVGGLKSNALAGFFRDGSVLAAENWVRGLLAPIDIESNVELLSRRVDTNDADSASAIAFSPNGRYAYVAHQGAARVSVYDMAAATLYVPGDGGTVPFDARVDVGDAPQGIVVSEDGRYAYVSNLLDRSVSILDVSDPAATSTVATLTVTSETLPSDIANGKRMFYRSREPVHSRGNYVACASCHADGGGHDGQVWDFTQKGEGLRNTIDLRGRGGLEDGPLHWSANFDEVQDFENDIVNAFGGTGLAQDGSPPNPPLGAPNAGRSRDLDDLSAYVSSLRRAPTSPLRESGGALSPKAERGRRLFSSAKLRCTECHPPPRFTTSALAEDPQGYLLQDTGTLGPGSGSRLGDALLGVDTPSLVGLWDSAPYFHDGRASTLRDVFRGEPDVLENRLTAHLSDGDLEALIAFLLTLDAHVELDPTGEGCTCRSQGGTDVLFWFVSFGAYALVRPSRKQWSRERGATKKSSKQGVKHV